MGAQAQRGVLHRPFLVRTEREGYGSRSAMRTLTFTAWLNVGLHLLGLALAMTGMRPGTPLVPAPERVAYLAARPLLWSLGWATWMLCALALVAFLAALARAVPEAGAILGPAGNLSPGGGGGGPLPRPLPTPH